MAARDNLLVMYVTVTLLVVTLQKTNKNKKKYYRFDRVCLCKYVCWGRGWEEWSNTPLPRLCCALNFDLSNALLKFLQGPAAMI